MNTLIAKLKKSNSVYLDKLYEKYTGRINGVQRLGRPIIISILLEYMMDEEEKSQLPGLTVLPVVKAIYDSIYTYNTNLTDRQVRIIRIMKEEGMTYKDISNWLKDIHNRTFQINYIRNVIIGKLYKTVT